MDDVLCRGLVLLLVEGLVKVIDVDLSDEILNVVLEYVVSRNFCKVGDLVVVLYCLGNVFFIKIMVVLDIY